MDTATPILIENRPLDQAGLLRLSAWLSPGFPVGAFSYSHGIEYAVECGQVRDEAALTEWVSGIVRLGAGRIDADLFCAAWRAVAAEDADALYETVGRGHAYRGTNETALESAAQGRAFAQVVRGSWGEPAIERWCETLLAAKDGPAYAVAVGALTAACRIPLGPALAALLHAMAANLISAGVRLVPLGQSAGCRALAALEPVIGRAAHEALMRGPDDFGSAAPMVDWTSMRHETQYTRLFRS